MFGGAQGSHVLFLKNDMQVPGYAPEMLMGVAASDMSKGEFGNVIQFGNLTPLPTSQWQEGDFLYADPFNAGAFTTTEPAYPQHSILVAAVIYRQNNNGTILIRPIHKDDLDELHNVDTTGVQVGDALVWDGANWVPQANFIDLTSVSQNIIPSVDVTYNLGSPTHRWNDLYLNGSTIHLGNYTMSVNQESGTIEVNNPSEPEAPVEELATKKYVGEYGDFSANFDAALI
jgi:hypothetical protein